MKYFTFLYLLIFNFSLLSSDIDEIPTFKKLYIFTYIYSNPSVGPVEGIEKTRVLMENRKIISTWSLKTGLESKDVLSSLIDVINGNTQGLQVEYDDNNFPKKIEPKVGDKLSGGGWYSLKIEDFSFIYDVNYTIDIKKLRMDEFKSNHQKWMKLNAVNYSFIYQDSRDKELNMDGIGVTVNSEKIIKASDIRSYQPITELKNRSFLTIRKLFDIVKRRLEENRQVSILYDAKYGYPYWIGFEDKNGDLYTIFSRNFRKEF